MNKKDLALLIMVGGISILISYFSFDALFKLDKPKKYKMVKVIDNTIDEPRSDIFTENSINPTVQILIGDEKSEKEKINKTDSNENKQEDNKITE